MGACSGLQATGHVVADGSRSRLLTGGRSSCLRGRAVLPSIRRGILKRRKPGIASFLPLCARRLRRGAVARAARRVLRTDNRHVTFCTSVRVTEFRRRLNGGAAMPTDGSLVTLGLGRPTRKSLVPLAKPRGHPGVVWIPPTLRVRLLRRCMGDARFFGAWSSQRWEMARIRRSRREDMVNPEDRLLMPWPEAAHTGAMALAQEVALWRLPTTKKDTQLS
mmetsp:Transcript_128441/g.256565  ORF Transcript_128441/g.256565 Transcript_128441/m.256565 type:complete len:220 (-) Transcript_128441:122-781(-)